MSIVVWDMMFWIEKINCISDRRVKLYYFFYKKGWYKSNGVIDFVVGMNILK